MLVLELITKAGTKMVMLNHVIGLDYESARGELTFQTADTGAFVAYLDKGTPEKDVWDLVKMALSAYYEPRSMHTHACRSSLDLRAFQTKEAGF